MPFSSFIFIGLCAIVFCFTFVLIFGAPFLPTLAPQITIALDMLDLRQGDMLLELGCGDGRVLVAAAQRGLYATGYELNPIMASIAWIRTRHYRGQVRVVCANFWHAEWPVAQGVFGFILPRYMYKLHQRMVKYGSRPVRVASFAFSIPSQTPVQIKEGVYLYEYK